MDKGKTLNPTFLDYKMPRSTDVPDIKVIDIITDDPDGPFGAKELPITPEKIVRALEKKDK